MMRRICLVDNKLVIGETIYTFGVIPATIAVKVEVAIAKVIGEPLFKSVTEIDFKNLGKEDDGKLQEIGGTAVSLIMSNMDSEKLLETMNHVFAYVHCNGTRIGDNIDSFFTGKNKELWQVFLYGLKYNFSDFIEGLLSTLSLKGAAKSSLSTQQT